MDNDINKKRLLMKQIKTLQNELIIVGSEKGLNNGKTVKLSQELDKLMNKLHKYE